jgi:hypothetical protein
MEKRGFRFLHQTAGLRNIGTSVPSMAGLPTSNPPIGASRAARRTVFNDGRYLLVRSSKA